MFSSGRFSAFFANTARANHFRERMARAIRSHGTAYSYSGTYFVKPPAGFFFPSPLVFPIPKAVFCACQRSFARPSTRCSEDKGVLRMCVWDAGGGGI